MVNTITTPKHSAIENWMVVYTRSNCEKKSSRLLSNNDIVSFCPTIKIKKKWADRYKLVETPLFKSYLFVYITPYEQLKVLQTPGVISFVKHCGRPVMISKSEIDRINTITNTYTDVQVINLNNLAIGDKIIINDGPLINYQGQIVELLGASVLMIMEQLGCAIVVKVNQSQVTRIGNNLALV